MLPHPPVPGLHGWRDQRPGRRRRGAAPGSWADWPSQPAPLLRRNLRRFAPPGPSLDGPSWDGPSWDGPSWDGSTWDGPTWDGPTWDGLGRGPAASGGDHGASFGYGWSRYGPFWWAWLRWALLDVGWWCRARLGGAGLGWAEPEGGADSTYGRPSGSGGTGGFAVGGLTGAWALRGVKPSHDQLDVVGSLAGGGPVGRGRAGAAPGGWMGGANGIGGIGGEKGMGMSGQSEPNGSRGGYGSGGGYRPGGGYGGGGG